MEYAARKELDFPQAETAAEKVSGKVIETELVNKHHMLVWVDEIVSPDNKIMEVHIDAKTGAVIDIEEEKAKSGRFKRPRS